MLDGPSVVAALKEQGVSHVVWLPDSELGTWESALSAEPAVRLLRACREGEAIALAAGLLLGGQRPVVALQCTGLFEAGDWRLAAALGHAAGLCLHSLRHGARAGPRPGAGPRPTAARRDRRQRRRLHAHEPGQPGDAGEPSGQPVLADRG